MEQILKLSLFCFRWRKTTKVPTRDRIRTHQAEAEVREVVEEVRRDEAEKTNDPNIAEAASNQLVESLVKKLKDDETGRHPDHLPAINLTKEDRTLIDPTPDHLTTLVNRVHPDTPGPDDIRIKSG